MTHKNHGDAVSVTERSDEQAAYEAALAEIEETILNIEMAIRRADRAEATLKSQDAPSRLIASVATTRQELAATRRRLQQAAYLAAEEAGLYGDQLAMFELPEDEGGQRPLI